MAYYHQAPLTCRDLAGARAKPLNPVSSALEAGGAVAALGLAGTAVAAVATGGLSLLVEGGALAIAGAMMGGGAAIGGVSGWLVAKGHNEEVAELSRACRPSSHGWIP